MKTEKPCQDHLGNSYPSITIMCREYGISQSAYSSRLKLGWTQEEALTKPNGRSKPSTDHLGNTYPTVRTMCEAWNIPYNTFLDRTKKGYTVEEALKGKPKESEQPTIAPYVPVDPDFLAQCGKRKDTTDNRTSVTTDHLGNTYPTTREMCEAWGVDYKTFVIRMATGWDLEASLTRRQNGKNSPPVYDHKGNAYPTVKDMCEAYNVFQPTFRNRLLSGWTLEDALTWKDSRNTPVTDHEGNVYRSIADMCKRYGVKCSAYETRIKSGLSQKDALTMTDGRTKTVTDHKGNTYPSITAMCEKYGVSIKAYEYRIRHGWTIRQALGKKDDSRSKHVTDHRGFGYPSISAMCKHYGLTPSVYQYRMKQGWSQRDALTIPVNGK